MKSVAQRVRTSCQRYFETRNHDHAAAMLSASAIPHRSELLVPRSRFAIQISILQAHDVNITHILSSGRQQIHAWLPEEFYSVVADLLGPTEHRTAGHTTWLSCDTGLVLSPLQDTNVTTPESSELLFFRLGRTAVVDELKKMLGRPTNAPLVFERSMDMRTEAKGRLRDLTLTLCHQLNELGTRPAARDLGVRLLENAFVSLLLQSQRHNYTRSLHRRSSAGPWQLRIAAEYIRAHPYLPLSLGDLSRIAGVNARTLQYSFHRSMGCGPIQFLRATRMEKARNDLLARYETTTVSAIASRWGFLHFGRFAKEYAERYGETPSETLRRNKRFASSDACREPGRR
jgi:AraC-like DNA-binding protein